MTAIFPGSFDPVTLGHLDMIRRAAAIFDRVVVAVMHNSHSQKASLITPQERVELIREAAKDIDGVEAVLFEGFTRDLCEKYRPCVLVKGVRNVRDFDYECEIAAANRFAGAADTLFLPAGEEFGSVSSTIVREFLKYGADISKLVPECVRVKLESKN